MAVAKRKKPMGRPSHGLVPKALMPFKIDRELQARLLNTADSTWIPANRIVEEAVRVMVEKLEIAYNAGKPFPDGKRTKAKRAKGLL